MQHQRIVERQVLQALVRPGQVETCSAGSTLLFRNVSFSSSELDPIEAKEGITPKDAHNTVVELGAFVLGVIIVVAFLGFISV